MEARNARAGAGALSRAAPVPHRPDRRRDDRLLPVAHRGRQPPAGRRHHRVPPAMVRRPGRRLRRPRRNRPGAARGHQAPGRAHRNQRNRPAARAPRARRRQAPARPRGPRLSALRRPARAARPGPRPHPRSPADMRTAPHLARPRHPDRPHRRPGHHRRQPARVRARPRARHHHAGARRGHRPRNGGRRLAARRRAAALALASPGLDPGHPDTAEAASYPETIAMAATILSAPPAGPE